ncbi:MAG: CoA transferase [Candidatus Dormibacteraeota bacterium]|uniref:CoA transferase n=1 Tax=Candidatus Nephthysia bennettiae TaxID=3127016 RepID=A0A934KA82_9BACT|nr:CoA transferase [Candidatus Dormibacteraeota bacterium]MBJ7614024.1 CoA transferase [Candidatus Dormibacteraeota bacterium]
MDVSRILAGPHCTMILADLGADIVKVESPIGDETRRWGPPFLGDTAAYYFAANRNKRSVALDLKSDDGRREFHGLLSVADVLVQNFTEAVARQLYVDADSVQRANPRCIHVTLSGYGPSHPDRRGYDLMAQALGGLMSVTGEPGGRGLKVGVPIADLTAGTYAATAVIAAIYDRSASGRVARIEVSLIDSVTSLLANQAMNWLLCQSPPQALGNDHPSVTPYGVFRTATDDIVVAVASDAQFRSLCEVIGRTDVAANSRYVSNAERIRCRAADGDSELSFLAHPGRDLDRPPERSRHSLRRGADGPRGPGQRRYPHPGYRRSPGRGSNPPGARADPAERPLP